jgi:hypothetical protein
MDDDVAGGFIRAYEAEVRGHRKDFRLSCWSKIRKHKLAYRPYGREVKRSRNDAGQEERYRCRLL